MTPQEEQTRHLRLLSTPLRVEVSLFKIGFLAVVLLFTVGIAFTLLTGVKFK
jgi:hypothetical protein